MREHTEGDPDGRGLEAAHDRLRQIAALHAGEHDCRYWETGHYPDDWPLDAPYGQPGVEWTHVFNRHFMADESCPTASLAAE